MQTLARFIETIAQNSRVAIVIAASSALVLSLASSAEAQSGNSQHYKRPFLAGGRAPTDEIAFRFTLPESKLTSAAVYDSRGSKIRDLWGARRLGAGTYNELWDGKNDDGVQMPPGTYTIKVLHHNLRFEYSNLFNSSLQPTGIGSYFQLFRPSAVRAGGSSVVWFCAYNESKNQTFLSTQQNPLLFEQNLDLQSMQWTIRDGSLDGNTVYVAANRNSYFGSRPMDNYVFKYNAVTRALLPFTGLVSDGLRLADGNGPAQANYSQNALPCGLDTSTSDRTYDIDRVAVMTRGRVLAVAQPYANRILFFDKVTGLQARAPLSVPKPLGLAWSKSESHLIVSSNSTVLRSFRDIGSALIPAASVDRRCHIVDVASDPVSGNVAVAFASPIQQVVAFEPTQLRERWRLGQPGGYSSTAVVQNDRFHFLKNHMGGSISFQPDGKLWVYDRALLRMQRFTAPAVNVTVDKTMHIADSYSFAADASDGSRLVASQVLGYKRDWNKKNKPGFGGQGAWQLDRFWGYNFIDTAITSGNDGIIHLNSYAGRLFGQMRAGGNLRLVELTNAGVRDIAAGVQNLGWDENLDRYTKTSTGAITRQAFLGLNASGNPTWAAPTNYAVFDPNHTTDPVPVNTFAKTLYPLLDGNVVTAFQRNDPNMMRYHIGALRPDGTWAWRHGRPKAASVPFPKDGYTTTLGNEYASAGAFAKDDFAILSWNGEFYDSGQAGKHLIYSRDGMYVDQVGHSSISSRMLNLEYAALGTNGNSYGAALMFEGGKYRFLHSNESLSSGITEWTFENLASYGVASKSAALGTSVIFDPISRMGDPVTEPGPTLDVDEFSRPNGTTIGNGWSVLPGALGFEIKDGSLAAIPTVYNREFTNIVYRGIPELDSCQKIYLPSSFFSPNLFAHISGANIRSFFGIAARLQPTSKALLMAFVRYDRTTGATPGTPTTNGTIKMAVYAYDGARYYSLGGIQAKYLPGAPGNAYSLRMIVSGTQPTKIDTLLWDETLNREVLRQYNESWEKSLEAPGYGGVSIGMGNVRVSRYEKLNFLWPPP